MKEILVLISVFFLLGCASSRDRTDKFLKENPVYFAEKCAINFPIQEIIIEGETKIDTIRISVPGVEIPCPEYKDEKGQLQKPKVKCPDQNTETIIKVRTDTIVKENTANVIRFKIENSELVVKNKNLEDKISEQKNTMIRLIIALAAVFALFMTSIYLHFKR